MKSKRDADEAALWHRVARWATDGRCDWWLVVEDKFTIVSRDSSPRAPCWLLLGQARMQHVGKERQIARLAESHVCGEKGGGEREGDQEQAEIGERLLAQARIGPHAAADDQEVRSPGGHGDQEVGPLQVAGAYPLCKALQAVPEKRGDEEICVAPQACRRDADEVSPAVAAECEEERGQVHPRLEEVQPAD